MIEATAAAWPFAIVELRGDGAPLYVPAALLYDTPDGFAIVTPAYKDPNGAGGHNFHRIVASVRKAGEGFEFAGPEWSGTIEPYEPSSEQLRQVGMALEWFEGYLEQQGVDLAEERERVKGILGPDLR